MWNEAQTRRQIIDKNLQLAGWNLKDRSQVIEELDIYLEGQGTRMVKESSPAYDGHHFADYALLLHGKPMAVIEAKRTSRDAELGKEQALQYAQKLQKIHGGPLPFVTYSNGHETYFWEYDFYPPQKVYGFPSRDDLEWFAQRRNTRKPLSVELVNTRIVERSYQIEAVRAILEGIERKRRKFLLVMATGTGKTRTAIAVLDALLRAHWAKRVLFLVDRIALRNQALDAFKDHMPSDPRWPHEGETAFSKNRRVYVTTYPTMLKLIEAGTTPESWISPHFFDVIIADESHRSIYNTYAQVLDYFNAIKLGLTATPKDHIDHDTFKLFDCGVNDPTFAYTYKEALAHEPPYLCDFAVLNVRSKFQLEGIQGRVLSPSEQKKLIAEGRDPEEINFDGTELEHKVTNAGTNALIVREFMEESIKDPSGTLPGKSIIFAISMKHARRLEQLFNDLYPEHGGTLARVIVSDDPRVYGKGGLLDQFRNQDMPRVAISVDMLDTGIDVLEIVNLVFAKPVYSYTKFWQMIGRGTRVLDASPAKRKPWCTEKDAFLIIDCWGNCSFFNMHPKGREPHTQEPLPVRLFKARLDQIESAIAASQQEMVETISQDLKQDLSLLPTNNVIVSDHHADLARVAPAAFWLHLTAENLGFLRAVVAPILRVRPCGDIKALRFEYDGVELSTALLAQNTAKQEALQESLIEQVAELPLSVNVVAREQQLIDAVLHTHWWATLTQETLRDMVRRLAPLMRYREQPRDPIMKLNIEDAMVLKEYIEFGPEHERLSSSAYRERVEAYIRSLVHDNLVLQKIQTGQPVTHEEIHALAHLLQQQSLEITEERLRKVYDHKTACFVDLMRHLLGWETLEPWTVTVTQAFDDFIATHNTFSSLQIQFMHTLKTFVLQTGRIERKALISLPFTRLHPDGIRGLFQPREIDEILQLAQQLTSSQ